MLDRLGPSLAYRLAASCGVVFGGPAMAALQEMAPRAEQQLQPSAQREAAGALAGLLGVGLSAAAMAGAFVTTTVLLAMIGKSPGPALKRTTLRPQALLAFFQQVVEVLQFTLRADPGAAK